MHRSIPIAWLLSSCAFASSCVLPGYEKVGELADEQAPVAAACGASDKLPRRCDACIREHCCAEATPCGVGTTCGAEMQQTIGPSANFSTDFDPLLRCMQQQCNAACSVDWGCLGNYTWPMLDGPVKRDVRVVPFLNDTPIAGVAVQACPASDPTQDCLSRAGVGSGVTDAQGMVSLEVEPDFDGVYNFRKLGYLMGRARWSEPIHRLAGFTQFELDAPSLAGFASATATVLDTSSTPGKGHLIVRVQTCMPLRYVEPPRSEGAENVQVIVQDFDQPSRVFYTEPGSGVSVDRQHTSTTGYCGVFNLPPQYVKVRAVELDGNREIASASVLMPPGGMAFVYMVPRSMR